MDFKTNIGNVTSNSTSSGTGGTTDKSQVPVIPENLKRFEVDGKIDVNKLASSYIDLEKEYHKTSQERGALSKSYELLAKKLETPSREEHAQASREQILEKPAEFVSEVARTTLEEMGKPIVDAVISMVHPEVGKNSDGTYKNPEFMKGLQSYINTFPEKARLELANFRGADWVIKQYKNLTAKDTSSSGSTVTTPFTESPSGSSGAKKGGKIWTREEVRTMMYTNPAEYAKVADEISSAMDEGRYE